MWTQEQHMWYAPVGRFTMREEGDWLRLRTEDGTEQDVLRRPGEVREEWQARALSALERFVNHTRHPQRAA
ncbi:MAG TPA: hypothetical protein VK807_06580 [Gemmatimonadaceae bacterium]|nr:hypothetical protein [Gemmatimonadaceae bacterium]